LRECGAVRQVSILLVEDEALIRMALAAMVVSLEMSRLGWKCGEVEETAMVLRAAAGHVKEKEWEAWVVGQVGKKG